MILSAGQQQAYDSIRTWLVGEINPTDKSSYLTTLCGSAGTGKTTLTRMIVKAARSTGKQVLCCAPTHKARKVLSAMVNTCSIIKIPVITTASLLGIQKKHSYVGTRNFGKEVSSKINMYDLIVIDEISMVHTNDYETIIDLACQHHKKILFIGDDAQIPNPGQTYKMAHAPTKYLTIAINPAFNLPNVHRLSQIIRNSSDNPLLEIYALIRDKIGSGFNISDLIGTLPLRNTVDGKGYQIFEKESDFIGDIVAGLDGFKPAGKDHLNKVVTYTNQSVNNYNRLIRSLLGYKQKIVENEVLMGYENIGDIENGQEYIVRSVRETDSFKIDDFDGLVGHVLDLSEISATGATGATGTTIFVPDLDADANVDVIDRLFTLAKKVNSRGSTKMDYVMYKALKSQLIFLEPVYSYRGVNYSETEFKQTHPLLNRATVECISVSDSGSEKVRSIIDQPYVHEIRLLYPDLLTERMMDNKEISDSELLLDIFKVADKDIDYGYAITAHKSQGSTYSNVYFDEANFNLLRDGWSFKYKCPINRNPERDRLKYVAITRAKNYVGVCGSQKGCKK
jgi:hypothetical protein